jgi:hypothetical protein
MPAAPVFLVDSKDHWINLWNTPKTTIALARFLDAKQFEFTRYDANLTAWKVRWNLPELSLWDRIANVLGRTRIDVPVQWTLIGTYNIDELRRSFIEAVAHDDDVLTQFVEREELVRRLCDSDSFPDFIEVWEWLSHEPA